MPHNAPIVLAEYDPDWPALFAREACRIRAFLGSTVILLEHAGSTGAGYVLWSREPDWFEHRMFRGWRG
jgi:GrpB protein